MVGLQDHLGGVLRPLPCELFVGELESLVGLPHGLARAVERHLPGFDGHLESFGVGAERRTRVGAGGDPVAGPSRLSAYGFA